jgi:hypothetical protein
MIGTNVVIPCVASGNSPYRQYWKDNFGNIVDTDMDPRRKVNYQLQLQQYYYTDFVWRHDKITVYGVDFTDGNRRRADPEQFELVGHG